MSVFGNRSGGSASPLQWAALWLSVTAGFAVSFIFTPRLYGSSVDWAVTSADLGPFLTWVGSVIWFCVVALLTLFLSNLVFFSLIMAASYGWGMIMTRLSR